MNVRIPVAPQNTYLSADLQTNQATCSSRSIQQRPALLLFARLSNQACLYTPAAIWKQKICTLLLSKILHKFCTFRNSAHFVNSTNSDRGPTCFQLVRIERQVKLQEHIFCSENKQRSIPTGRSGNYRCSKSSQKCPCFLKILHKSISSKKCTKSTYLKICTFSEK